MTLEQKISFYKALYGYVEGDSYEDGYVGFCYHITYSLENWYRSNEVDKIYAYDETALKKRLPELYAYNPKVGPRWFTCDERGKHQRLNILKDIIKKLQKDANI